jgi:hypothetical protein
MRAREHALIVGIALLLHLPAGTFARDFSGRFETLGAGGGTCGRYTTVYLNRQTDNAPLFANTQYFSVIHWMMGYLSAYNAMTDGVYSIIGNSDSNALGAWLYNYCQSHPLENVSEAMPTLIEQLRPRASRGAPK